MASTIREWNLGCSVGGEVAFDRMRDDVGGGIHQIVTRYRLHQRRIDDGNLGEGVHRADGELFLGFLISHHSTIVHFTAGGGQRQDVEYRQCGVDAAFADEQIPHIAVVARAGGDGLGAVEHRAATDAQDGIDLMCAGQRNGFAYFGDYGVADNAAAFDVVHAVLVQAVSDCGEQAIALDAVAAIAQQHSLDIVLGQNLANQLLLTSAELDLGWVEEGEVIHFVVLGNGLA